MLDRGASTRQSTTGRARDLRVCHVTYSFYENDNRVMRYAEMMASAGAAVDIFSLRRPGQSKSERLAGVHVHRLQTRAVDERRALDYLIKILCFLARVAVALGTRSLTHRYDVVHVHNVPDFLVFAACVPKLLGARVILDIHDVLPELYAGKFGTGSSSRMFSVLRLVERMSCRFADHVIVANHLWYERVADRTGSRHKCTAILNYPDLTLFTPGHSSRRHDDPFVFLYPGTLNEHQGMDIAIRAFASVADRIPNSQFRIFGEGPARASLEALVKSLNLTTRILIRDRVPLVEVPALMRDADVGVVPKRADGFGNEAFSTKILEFMACGVPVIVSRTRVDTHYFTDLAVQFFEAGSHQSLADAMLRMYQDRDHLAERVRQGLDLAGALSWQARGGDYRAIVDRLAGHPTVRREALLTQSGGPS